MAPCQTASITLHQNYFILMTNSGPCNRTIFIAGCGRSGTTYLRTIIDAHPDIFIPTESLFIIDYFRYGQFIPTPILQWLFFHEPQLRAWYNGTSFPIDNVSKAITRVHKHTAEQYKAKLWGQKTPRFIRHMDLFENYIPNIKWILIYRDPRAVAASMLKSTRHTYSIDRACRRWIRDNKPIVKLLKSQNQPRNIFILKYETLIKDFDKVVLELFNFIGVAPISPHEIFEKGRVKAFKNSNFEVNAVRGNLKPQKNTINSWEKELTAHQVWAIEAKCFDMMETLGYRALLGKHGFRDNSKNVLEEYKNKLKDFLILLEYMKKWPYYLIHTALRKILFFLCSLFRIRSSN